MGYFFERGKEKDLSEWSNMQIEKLYTFVFKKLKEAKKKVYCSAFLKNIYSYLLFSFFIQSMSCICSKIDAENFHEHQEASCELSSNRDNKFARHYSPIY